MCDVIKKLSEALATKSFDTASSAVDFVLKENNAEVDFETFVRLNELAQTQLETDCCVKFFI